jgi:hypothetical protein
VNINLEVATWDKEEWEGNGLTTWDEPTTEDHDQNKSTKALEIYQDKKKSCPFHYPNSLSF